VLVEGLFRAADEHWVAITVEHEAAAERLRADGVPLEADALAGWIAARSADTVERFFVMRGAAAAAVRRAGEMADAGGPGAGLAVTQGPDGVPVKGLPWMMNGTVAAGRNAAPPLGGDNRAIAVDLLGRDPAEYEQLVAMGILADAPRAA
jgi:crotonobetainyl-CoA:carnitine CoA-transferase CaiB-like acyl-CoA transferase